MKYNWKDSISKWMCGVPMELEELENLSSEMECCIEERYWIDLEILRLKGECSND